MSSLLAELQAIETAPRVMLAAVRQLEAMGVARDFALGLVGNGELHLAPVELRPRSGLFEFCPDGQSFASGGPADLKQPQGDRSLKRRLILAVWRGEQLIDLVALASHDENQWALRLGMADLLGMDVLEHAIATEAREVRLYATPMDWLRAEGRARAQAAKGGSAERGICVLDWNRQALGALRGLRPTQTLVVDPGARDKLKGLLAYGGLPLVAEAPRDFRRAA